MALSTIYLYKLTFPAANETDAQIQKALDVATAYISSYCDRKFEDQTHLEFYNGNCNDRFLANEWPITSIIDFYSAQEAAITVTVEPTIYDVRISSNASALTLTSRDWSSTETTTEFYWSSYQTWTALNTAIDALGTVSTKLVASEPLDPTFLCVPINVAIHANNNSDIMTWVFDDVSYTIDPVTNRYFNFTGNSGCGSKKIYLKYRAGYIYPVDNGGHTALTTVGTVPADLQDLCNRLAYIILNDMITGIKSGGYSAEHLGDYGYSIGNWNGLPLSSITGFLASYGDLLDRYKRISYPM